MARMPSVKPSFDTFRTKGVPALQRIAALHGESVETRGGSPDPSSDDNVEEETAGLDSAVFGTFEENGWRPSGAAPFDGEEEVLLCPETLGSERPPLKSNK